MHLAAGYGARHDRVDPRTGDDAGQPRSVKALPVALDREHAQYGDEQGRHGRGDEEKAVDGHEGDPESLRSLA